MLLAACCLLVAVVSVHDATLVILHEEVIADFERNPIGRVLLELQGGQVWLFVVVKLAGTAIVCATLIMLYEYHRRIALASAVGVTVFQLTLFVYLTIA